MSSAAIVFESAARLLVVLHAAAAVVLIGASTHNLIITYGFWRGVYKMRLARIYGATVAVAYAVTFVLGAVAYPAFRYYVRALYLDRYEPWASNLFDIKEHFASIGIPFVLGAWLLSRTLDPKVDRTVMPAYAVMVFAVAVIVWFNMFSGLIITLERGV